MAKTPPQTLLYIALSFRLVVWVLAGGWSALVMLAYLAGSKDTTLAVQQAGRASDYLVGLAGPTAIAFAIDRTLVVLSGFVPRQSAEDEEEIISPKRWS
jgi:hypothetical protein